MSSRIGRVLVRFMDLTVSSSFTTWFASVGFIEYCPKLSQLGYETLTVADIRDFINEKDMDAIATELEMKPAHVHKLITRWKNLRATSSTLLHRVERLEQIAARREATMGQETMHNSI